MASPKKWWEVYGGDEEKRFFVGADGQSGLCRHGEFGWRSVDNIAKESNLSKIRVEEIISKYVKSGLVIQHKNDPEKWGYWERVGQKATTPDVVGNDKKDRVEKAKTSGGKP